MTKTRHRWMKFWPQDWQGDPALRMCSLAARGLWMDMLCIMHAATPYGHLLVAGRPPTVAELAKLTGRSHPNHIASLLNELRRAGVFSEVPWEPQRGDIGAGSAEVTPEGGPSSVEAVSDLPRLVIVSRRMVRDWLASEKGREVGRRGGNPALRRGTRQARLGADLPPDAERGEKPAEKPAVPPADPFLAFWAAYPRKVGKENARKSYARATKAGATPDEILAGLKRAEFDTREGGRFIPHPATWLNQGRWQDQGLDLGAVTKPGDDEPSWGGMPV